MGSREPHAVCLGVQTALMPSRILHSCIQAKRRKYDQETARRETR